jgi:hypothetical protein
MTEKSRYFAIIPIHGSNALVEGKTIDELQDSIGEALQRPELYFPFHNFWEEIRVIKGREIKLPQPPKIR